MFLSLSNVVSWVRCGTLLYRFLIFAFFFTFTNQSEQKMVKQLSYLDFRGGQASPKTHITICLDDVITDRTLVKGQIVPAFENILECRVC